MFKIAKKDHSSSNPGWNPGSDPSSNPGSDPSSSPGSNPGSKFRYPPLKYGNFENIIQSKRRSIHNINTRSTRSAIKLTRSKLRHLKSA